MSFEAMANAVGVENIKPTEKLILLLLANYADEKNRCYPSYETIAKLANCSRMTVIRSIDKLATQGIISIHKRKKDNKDNLTNIYTINEIKPASNKDIDPGNKLSPPPSNNLRLPSNKCDKNPSNNLRLPSNNLRPNTITNTINKEPITKYKEIDVSKFGDGSIDIVKQLIDYRIAIKAPLKTDRGLTGLINSIKKVSEEEGMTFVEVMEIMMQNEWQSIKSSYSFDRPNHNPKGNNMTFKDIGDAIKAKKEQLTEKNEKSDNVFTLPGASGQLRGAGVVNKKVGNLTKSMEA